MLVLFFSACEKDEGKGGSATITGKIFVQDYNQEGELKDEYYPGEYSVYLIYGDETTFGDKETTHFDGSYVFEYLYPGNYTVFAYSKCRECPGEREIKKYDMVLNKGEVKNLEDLIVED